MKKKILYILSFIIATLLLAGVIYAVTTISVIENNQVNLESSDFIISDSDKYFKEIGNNETIRVENRRNNPDDTYDLLILTKDYSKISNLCINNNSYQSFVVESLNMESLSISYTNASDNEVYACVVAHDERNRFVYSYIDLLELNQVYLTNSDLKNDSTAEGNNITNDINNYFNIYFMSDIEINRYTLLNIPGKYDLLISDIIMNSNLNIVHNHASLTTLTSISGKIKCSLDSQLLIECLNSNIDIKPDLVDGEYILNDSSVSNKEELIKGHALSYIDSYIPSFLLDSITLYNNYFVYDITYSYEISNKDEDNYKPFNGIINKEEDTREYRIKYHIKSQEYNIDEIRYKDIKVAGTSDSSINEYLDYLIKDYLSYIGTIKDDKLYIEESFDLKSLFKRFFFNDSNVTISLSNLDNVMIKLNGNTLDLYELVISFNNGNIEVSGQNVSSLSLCIDNEIYLSNDVELHINFNNETNNTYILSFKSLTEEEKNQILERYITNVYFSNTNPIGLPYLNENRIYLEGNALFNSSFGLSSIDYNVYLMTNQLLERFKRDGITSADITLLSQELLRGEYYIKWSTLNDGDDLKTVLKTQADRVSIYDGYSLAYIASISYENNTYYLIKDIHIPEKGIGGEDEVEYTSSNVFAKYFQDYILQTTDYIFKTEDFQVKLDAKFTILNGVALNGDTNEILNNGNPYVTIESREVNGSVEYRLNVDISNAPKTNSDIGINFRFYTVTGDVEKEISSQNYTFTIPGVIRYKNDVESLSLYAAMLLTYGDYKGFLLAIDVIKPTSKLNVDLELLNKFYTNDPTSNITANYLIECGILADGKYSKEDTISLRGIEYLTNTHDIDISLNNTASIESLESLSALNLKSLRLSGCMITSSMLSANSKYPLYSLKELEVLDLSFNNINDINDNYFYRSIKRFNISSQNDDLKSIKGITKLINLEYLDVSNNKIQTFNELKELTKLKEARIYNNICDNVLFGTRGKANISLYVSIFKNVNIYIKEDEIFGVLDGTPSNNELIDNDGSLITNELYLGTIVINSLVYNDLYKATNNVLSLPGVIYEDNTQNGSTHYSISIAEAYLNGKIVNSSSSDITGITSGGKALCVISIAYGSLSVYRALEFDIEV